MKHTGTCVICHKQFTRNRPLRGTVCSPKCRGVLLRKSETRTCIGCGKQFECKPSYPSQHCSIRCFNATTGARKKLKADMTRTCEHCGKSYRRAHGAIKRRFCSNRCGHAHRLGPKQHKLRIFEVGRNQLSKGKSARKTTQEFKTAFPFCQRCGWREEPVILHVHHRDRNRKNLSKTNLEVLCPTCHVLEHYRTGDSIWIRT